MVIIEAIKYINQTAWQGNRLGLERMELLLGLLGNPERKFKYIHNDLNGQCINFEDSKDIKISLLGDISKKMLQLH